MVHAIVTKELREIRLLASLALALYVVYLCKLTGHWSSLLNGILGWAPGLRQNPPEVPFVNDGFITVYGFIGAALALALGFRQSAWEPSQGTALYLLHRPLHRRTIFLTKLLTGLGVQLACTFLPIVVYASWAVTPGTHAGPFEWSMTGPMLRLWLTLPLVYLGAFASGLRPARWFGSRLLPLVAVVLPVALFQMLPHWWLIAFPALLLTALALISVILLEAETRDYA
jgi:hypothetical protein